MNNGDGSHRLPRDEWDAPVAAAIEAHWSSRPGPDIRALWQRIEPGLGRQTPPRPWFRYAFLTSLPYATTRLALSGAAAAAVAAALLVGVAVLRPTDDASAAVLEAVNKLSVATSDALDDDQVTDDEASELQRRARELLARIEGRQDALGDLSTDELAVVVTNLESVLDRISSYHAEGAAGGTLEATQQSVRQVSAVVSGEREERSRSSGEDDRRGIAGSEDVAHEDDEPDDRTTPTPTPSATPAATSVPGATATGDREAEHDDEGEHDGDPSAVSTPTPAPGSGTAVALPADATDEFAALAGEYSYTVGDAGSVRFAFDGHEDIEVLEATPNPGWSVSIDESDGDEIRVTFVRDGARGHFEASQEGSKIEVSVAWER